MPTKKFDLLPATPAVPDNRTVDTRVQTPAPGAPAALPSRRLQRISGPYKGYFILAFAIAVNDRFAGRARICLDRPSPDRKVRAFEQVSSVGSYESEEKAVQAAEYQARFIIDGLTPNWAPFTAPGTF